MRIAHVVSTFLPYKGGTGAVCYHNARILAQRGHEVHVFTTAYPGAASDEELDGIHVHRLRPLLRLGNGSFLPQLAWWLSGFDLLHLHYPCHGCESVGLAVWRSHIPLVVTYHQDVILAGWRGGLDRALRYTVWRLLLRSARRFLFTSLDYGRASHIYPLLRGREAIIADQPNGVDVNLFSPGSAPAALREKLGLRQDDRTAVLVASLDRAHYFKGVPVFLQALCRLPEAIKGVVVGDGDLLPVYEAQAQALGLQGRLVFPGRVTDAELLDYYRLADVGVLPSVTMGEAFGMVLIEAMACGKPVIASDLPGVRTVVSDGQDGFLVQPENASALTEKMQMLLNLPSWERQAMGARGREKVIDRYAWDKLALLLERHYQAALKQEPGFSSRSHVS